MADEPKCIHRSRTPLPKKIQPIQNKRWHFHWLHKDPRFHSDELFNLGYKFVTKSGQFEKEVSGDPRIISDGRIQHGDLLLAFCPFKEWQDRSMERNKKTHLQIEAQKRAFHSQTRKEGVGTFEENRPGPPGTPPTLVG